MRNPAYIRGAGADGGFKPSPSDLPWRNSYSPRAFGSTVGFGLQRSAVIPPVVELLWSASNVESSEEQLKAEPLPARACCIGWRNDIPPVGGAIRLQTRLLTSLNRMKVLKYA